jgi:TetR/AcrR family transcriptional repressor of nem operon
MPPVRYPPDRKSKTRERILDAAANLIRRQGIEETGVDEVMKAAGLTAGGFYSHFRSKDALVTDAVDRAGQMSFRHWFAGLDELYGREFARELIDRYLSPEHREDREHGCILPTLGSDMARARKPTRQRFERRLAGLLELIEAHTQGASAPAREAIVATVALSIGGVVLSRAVNDRAFSDEILRASRSGAHSLLGLTPRRGRRRP